MHHKSKLCGAFRLIFVSTAALVGLYIFTAFVLHSRLDSSATVVDTPINPSGQSEYKPTQSLVKPSLDRNSDADVVSVGGSPLGHQGSTRLLPSMQCPDLNASRESVNASRLRQVIEALKSQSRYRLSDYETGLRQNLRRGAFTYVGNNIRKIDVKHPTLSSCEGIVPGRESSGFQQLEEHYLFSAYFDDRMLESYYEQAQPDWMRPGLEHKYRPVIRIIAMLKRTSAAPSQNISPSTGFFCHFHSNRIDQLKHSQSVESMNVSMRDAWLSGHTVKVAAELYEMCENHGKKFGGWILTCAIPPRGVHQRPCSIHVTSLSVDSTTSGSSSGDLQHIIRLPVYRTKPDKTRFDFAICLPPLFGRIERRTLIKFIELNRLLGVVHFVLYVSEPLSDIIASVLRYYELTGVVTVVPWIVPVSRDDVWYGGQLIAINDCLYRSMHAALHVAFNDIDEFIVPRASSNWKDMLAKLNNSQSRKLCSYTFKSAFFDPMTADSDDVSAEGASDVTNNPPRAVTYELESTLRSRSFSAVRSKVMVAPREVFELGIHHVSRLLDERRCVAVREVSPAVGYVRHYRRCVKDYDVMMDCEKTCQDEGLLRYVPVVRGRAREVLKEIDYKTDSSRISREVGRA